MNMSPAEDAADLAMSSDNGDCGCHGWFVNARACRED